VEEPVFPVGDDGMWYPNLFEEDLGSIFHCVILLADSEDGHLQKSINDHKHLIIAILGGQKAKHVIH